jgi:hypothetical protein
MEKFIQVWARSIAQRRASKRPSTEESLNLFV